MQKAYRTYAETICILKDSGIVNLFGQMWQKLPILRH